MEGQRKRREIKKQGPSLVSRDRGTGDISEKELRAPWCMFNTLLLEGLDSSDLLSFLICKKKGLDESNMF